MLHDPSLCCHFQTVKHELVLLHISYDESEYKANLQARGWLKRFTSGDLQGGVHDIRVPVHCIVYYSVRAPFQLYTPTPTVAVVCLRLVCYKVVS